MGGLHFRDVDSLRPVFEWEAFPRTVETDAEGRTAFSDVSYELRVHQRVDGRFIVADRQLHSMVGLTEPRYRYPAQLQSCGWYCWSVRARFRLHGGWRVTEWGGAYNTAGGHYSPSSGRRNTGSTFGFVWPAHHLFCPFRTPASGSDPGCWSS